MYSTAHRDVLIAASHAISAMDVAESSSLELNLELFKSPGDHFGDRVVDLLVQCGKDNGLATKQLALHASSLHCDIRFLRIEIREIGKCAKALDGLNVGRWVRGIGPYNVSEDLVYTLRGECVQILDTIEMLFEVASVAPSIPTTAGRLFLQIISLGRSVHQRCIALRTHFDPVYESAKEEGDTDEEHGPHLLDFPSFIERVTACGESAPAFEICYTAVDKIRTAMQGQLQYLPMLVTRDPFLTMFPLRWKELSEIILRNDHLFQDFAILRKAVDRAIAAIRGRSGVAATASDDTRAAKAPSDKAILAAADLCKEGLSRFSSVPSSSEVNVLIYEKTDPAKANKFRAEIESQIASRQRIILLIDREYAPILRRAAKAYGITLANFELLLSKDGKSGSAWVAEQEIDAIAVRAKKEVDQAALRADSHSGAELNGNGTHPPESNHSADTTPRSSTDDPKPPKTNGTHHPQSPAANSDGHNEGRHRLVLDGEKMEISYKGKPLDLSGAPYRVLAKLIEANGKVCDYLTLQKLAEDIAGTSELVTNNPRAPRCVTDAIAVIRKQLELTPWEVKNITETGYKLVLESLTSS